MKITVLVDNNDGPLVKGEWGLSFYIEYGEKKVLLDAGETGLFADNAQKLGIDLSDVDYAVLSHAHSDHANGMETFFARNNRAKLYVAKACDENCYDRPKLLYKYAGIPRGMMTRYADRIVKAEPDMYIDEDVRLLGHTTPGLEQIGRREKMFLKQGFMKYIPDDFRHEQSLVFELPAGIVIFNSCSHAGADNIIREVREVYPDRKILAMIGGFHLFDKSDKYVMDFAGRLRDAGAESIYSGHCTGKNAMDILKKELGEIVREFFSGQCFVL